MSEPFDINTEPAGARMDRAVAELIGKATAPTPEGQNGVWIWLGGALRQKWSPSTDIAAAFEVWKKRCIVEGDGNPLGSSGLLSSLSLTNTAMWVCRIAPNIESPWSETPELAICRACLLAAESMEKSNG